MMGARFHDQDDPIQPHELGAFVFACRPRSEKDRLIAMGMASAITVYLYPILTSLGLTVFLYIIPLNLLGWLDRIPQPQRLWSGIGVYAVACLFMTWWTFRHPNRPMLVLRELGFIWKRRPFLFEDISWIKPGRDVRGLESVVKSVNQVMGIVIAQNRVAAEAMDLMTEASLTVYRKSGPPFVLKGVGILCEAEDFAEFFARLVDIHPHIFDPPPRPDGLGRGLFD